MALRKHLEPGRPRPGIARSMTGAVGTHRAFI